jgi:hypothetical protein
LSKRLWDECGRTASFVGFMHVKFWTRSSVLLEVSCQLNLLGWVALWHLNTTGLINGNKLCPRTIVKIKGWIFCYKSKGSESDWEAKHKGHPDSQSRKLEYRSLKTLVWTGTVLVLIEETIWSMEIPLKLG